jgi:PadR family transcriptional regulator PadR
MDHEEIQAQLRKGVLEYAVILLLGRATLSAQEILEELDLAGLSLSPGTLYPLLARMNSKGVLTENWQPSPAGPPRKFLALTAEGFKLAKVYKNSWDELATTLGALRAR